MKNTRGNGVVKISNLFEKYKKILKAPQASVVNAFQEAVKEIIGVDIPPHQCAYTPRVKTLMLHINGPLKTEVLFKRKEILSKMEEKIGEKSTPKQIL